jgi:hypothetical protein
MKLGEMLVNSDVPKHSPIRSQTCRDLHLIRCDLLRSRGSMLPACSFRQRGQVYYRRCCGKLYNVLFIVEPRL